MMYRVPDRWLDYSRCGEVIGYTGILATKTPLKKDFHTCKERPEGVPPSEEFTPTQLVKYCIKNERRVGLVVDLTNKEYYDPKEFESFGIKYAKICCPGKKIPREIYPEFAKVLENHLGLIDPGVIVVHCTRGVNRTGYLVCRFLMQHFKYTADNAIKEFNTARGHSMDREDYIVNIHAYWWQSQKAAANTVAIPKTQQSKSSAVYRNSSSQSHDAHDHYGNDFDYQNDDGDNDDNEYRNPRYKGKNRRSQNEWNDECHKDTRRKGKHPKDDQMYPEDDWDYDDIHDYNDDHDYSDDHDYNDDLL